MNRHLYIRNRKKLLAGYTRFLALWSLSFVPMPLVVKPENTQTALLIFLGACFWIGCIGTVLSAIRIIKCKEPEETKKRSLPGILRFFQNRPASIADAAMLISLVAFLLVGNTEALIVPFLTCAVFVFSFGMHCVLNGSFYEALHRDIRHRHDKNSDENPPVHKVRRDEES